MPMYKNFQNKIEDSKSINLIHFASSKLEGEEETGAQSQSELKSVLG